MRKVLILLIMVLMSFFVIGQPVDEEGSVDYGDPESVNEALENGNVDFSKIENFEELNQDLLREHADEYLEHFQASQVDFQHDGSLVEFGSDGTISTGSNSLTAEQYATFPSGTGISVESGQIIVNYPDGENIQITAGSSNFVINSLRNTIGGIPVVGKLLASDGQLYLESGDELGLSDQDEDACLFGGVSSIYNQGPARAKVVFGEYQDGAVCVYPDMVNGKDIKGITLGMQNGLAVDISDASFAIKNTAYLGDTIGLQRLLNDLGIKDENGHTLEVDDVLGRLTKSAVRNFQEKLEDEGYLSGEWPEAIDGKPGPRTIQAINEFLPSIYIDGSSKISNPDGQGNEVYHIGPFLRLKLGNLGSSYILETPSYQDIIFDHEHRMMSSPRFDNQFLTRCLEDSSISTGQDIINEAYKIAGGDSDEAFRIITEALETLEEPSIDVDTLLTPEGRATNFMEQLRGAPYRNADLESVPPGFSPKGQSINEFDVMDSLANDYQDWVAGGRRISKTPQGHNYPAFDVAGQHGSTINFPDLSVYLGRKVYGKVRHRGSDSQMTGMGNHYFVDFYYEDGEPVTNLAGEHIGILAGHYTDFDQDDPDVGSVLNAGDPMGDLGDSGRSTGAHMHFEIGPWDQIGPPQLGTKRLDFKAQRHARYRTSH